MILDRTTIPVCRISGVARLIGRCGRVSFGGIIVVTFSMCASSTMFSSLLADEDGDEAVAPAANVRQFRITEQSFDQMVFGVIQQQQANGRVLVVNAATRPGRAEFRKRIDVFVAAEIRCIDQKVSLTEAQKKKLQLAARGDIAEHINRAEELRPKLTSQPLDQQQYVELMKQLQPLRMTQQSGIFGENSLFRKTLRRTLTPDQQTRYQLLERERQATLVNNVLVSLNNIEWGLKEEIGKANPQSRQANRQKFVDELLTHGKLPRTQNVYFRYAVLLEIARLEERLKPLVTEETWKTLQARAIDARRFEAEIRLSEQTSETDEEADDETKD